MLTEQDDTVARPRALLTARACWWAIRQIRREHASVLGLARQLGTTWRTLWRAIEPLLQEMAADESRFDGVNALGVDELCAHPDEALSPTGHSTELGFAPSTISTATAALAEAGLVDEDRRAVLPELFWELAGAWRLQWTWLAGRPDHDDTWALTGDRVAAASGAPLVSAGGGPLELFVPDPMSITLAARRYGIAPPGTGAAAVAVAPVRQALTGAGRLDGWRTVSDVAVALGLAGDPARGRGREILQDWPGQGHVWL